MLSQEQIDQIYGRLTAGPIPDGQYLGDLFFARGESLRSRLEEIVGGIEGRVISVNIGLLEKVGGLIWKGKEVKRDQRILRNMIEDFAVLGIAVDNPDTVPKTTIPRDGPLRRIIPRDDVFLLFPAKIYCGQSLLDARRESVIVDYSYNDDIEGYRKSPDSLAGRGGLRIRDEIRMVRPGLYLGRAYANRAFLLNFTLFNAEVAERDGAGVCPRRRRRGRLLAGRAATHNLGSMITLPPPTWLELRAHGALRAIQRGMRRIDPFFRPAFNAIVREPTARAIQWVMNVRRQDQGFRLAEEQALPGEEESLDSVIETFATYMRQNYRPGEYQRGGNTKTHGVVRAEFIVRDDVPGHMRHGVFAKPHTYRSWVRFSGPGPDMPKDIEDVGFVSCAIKLMDVPGPKILDDEKATQDFISVCTPTFVTPDINANAMLQAHVLRGTPVFYFFTTGFSHFLDFLMQGLWNETQTSPLEARYWSCVPYLLGPGQAMMYSVRPKAKTRSRIANLPFGNPSDNYLREAMIKTLVGNGCRIRFHGAGADRSAPDADRGRRRALA